MSDSDSDSDSSSEESQQKQVKQSVTKPAETNDSDSDSSSDESEEEAKATPAAAAQEDDSDSDDSSGSDSDEAPAKKTQAPAKAVKPKQEDDSSSSESEEEKPAEQKKAEDSDSDSSDSESEEETKKVQKPSPSKKTKKEEKYMSDSDSSSDEEEGDKPAKATKATQAKEEDSDSDSSSDEEEKPAEKAKEAESDSDSSSDEEEKPAKAKKATPAQAEESDSDSSSDEEPPVPKKADVKAAKEDSDSESSSDEGEEEAKPAKASASKEDEEEEKEQEAEEAVEEKKPTFSPVEVTGVSVFRWDLKSGVTQRKKRKLEGGSSQVAKKQKSAKASTAPAVDGDFTPEKEYNADDFRSAHLKDQTCCLIVKGIDSGAFEKDVKEFFMTIAEPTRVKHLWSEDKPGLAFVDFATPEQCSKAVIDLNREYIKNRWVQLDWAEQRKQSTGGGRGGGRGSGPRNANLKGTTKRIWIGNLHREVDDSTLKDLFKDCGEITDMFIMGRDEYKPKMAYVSFESEDAASKVVEEFQGHQLMDSYMRLDWAEERRSTGRKRKPVSEKPEGCTTVFIAGLKDSVTDDDLIALFEGTQITDIRFIEKEGVFKGYGYIDFADSAHTDIAVEKNGTDFQGKSIRVDYQAPRKKNW